MNAATQRAIERALGRGIVCKRTLSGGDINEAFELVLDDGERVFAKCNDRADPRMFDAEARGLSWLRSARALRVPDVLAVSMATSSGAPSDECFLVLSWLTGAAPASDFDERLGTGLAALHRSGAAMFGLDHDNFIGRLPQENTPCPTWAEFYRERRLAPQLALARRAGHLDAGLERRFEELLGRLEELVGPREPPARLHGDLWGGNLLSDEHGDPALIDPAAYGGHREIDLAMMRLFGGFGTRVFEAYAEAHPLAAGHRERVPLYQLYPLLVHLNTFGAGYLRQVSSALAAVRPMRARTR